MVYILLAWAAVLLWNLWKLWPSVAGLMLLGAILLLFYQAALQARLASSSPEVGDIISEWGRDNLGMVGVA
jgi:hypothetical protein